MLLFLLASVLPFYVLLALLAEVTIQTTFSCKVLRHDVARCFAEHSLDELLNNSNFASLHQLVATSFSGLQAQGLTD